MNISSIRDDFYLYRQKLKQIEKIKEQFNIFSKLSTLNENRFGIEYDEKKIIHTEAIQETVFDRQYIYHTAWAFRTIYKIKPEIHTDISSSLYFIGMLSSFKKPIFLTTDRLL
jgi:hypothetical protein